MKVLITSGTYPPKVGGSSYYAYNLKKELINQGHEVKVLSYGIEDKLPSGVRHLYFFFRVLQNTKDIDFILALDTFSVGAPSVWASKIRGKKSIIRIGGDFLWEHYVNRTGDQIPFPKFYEKLPNLNLKERIIFSVMKRTLSRYDAVVFNTEWQRDIFAPIYNLKDSYVIWNHIPQKEKDQEPKGKLVVSVGRDIPLKNQKILKEVLDELKLEYKVGSMSFADMQDSVKDSYIVVMPSISDMSPGFIIEGIIRNKPFVVTKYNGFSDDVNELGLSVEPLDKNDIKEKIEFLLIDDNYKKYKEKIKAFNKTNTWSDITRDFIDVYSKIV